MRDRLERWMARLPRVAPLIAVAGTLFAALLFMLQGPSLVWASINPPHEPDFVAYGEPFSSAGFAVASAGDVNGDGYGDVIAGANGSASGNKAYVYIGSNAGLSTTAYFTASPPGIMLPFDAEEFGASVASGGDIDGNGADDFVVGAYQGGDANQGRAYVYTSSVTSLPTLAISLTGELFDDRFGFSMGMVGDLNDDGFADFGVGAPFYSPSDAGRVYIYHGGSITSTPSYTLTGESALDNFGVSVAAAGDVNGDGYDDLVVGAHQPNTDELGKAYVYYGGETGIDATNVTILVGAPSSHYGTSVHGAGDVNGDGYDDVVIGVPRTISDTGTVFVYLGSDNGLVITSYFTATGEAEEGQFGSAVSGAGDVNGDGFADILVGANKLAAPAPDQGKAYGYAGCLGGIQPSLIFSDTGEAESDNYGRSVAIVRDVNGDDLDDYVMGAFGGDLVVGENIFPTGKVLAYYGARGSGCEAQIVLSKTVSLANFGPLCGPDQEITVPISSEVNFCYRVQNSGNLTLTHHFLDDPALGNLAIREVITLTPGASYTYVLTRAPISSVSSAVTWTATVSASNPFDIVPKEGYGVISATATSSVTVTLSGPTSDQDNDGVPDNEEGVEDADGDGVPAYLDADEQPEPEPTR